MTYCNKSVTLRHMQINIQTSIDNARIRSIGSLFGIIRSIDFYDTSRGFPIERSNHFQTTNNEEVGINRVSKLLWLNTAF